MSTQTLQEVFAAQIAAVTRRVEGGGNLYAEEIQQVRYAVERVEAVRSELGLGRFVRSITPPTGKPQFLLVFESGRVGGGAPEKVLKVYGRSLPGEGLIQHQITQQNGPVVPTIDYSDNPTSWLLMEPVPGHTLTDELQQQPDRLLQRTTDVAAAMTRVSTSVSPHYDGAQTLEHGILRHLDVVVQPLVAHGYDVPADWREHAVHAYNSGRKLPLHNDLFDGNVRVATNETLIATIGTDVLICDTAADACVGAPEFDGARWVARQGTPETFDAVAEAWNRGAPGTNETVFRDLLTTEVLMQAGVREIIKDEQGLPWAERDSQTVALLEYYVETRSLETGMGLDGRSATPRAESQ